MTIDTNYLLTFLVLSNIVFITLYALSTRKTTSLERGDELRSVYESIESSKSRLELMVNELRTDLEATHTHTDTEFESLREDLDNLTYRVDEVQYQSDPEPAIIGSKRSMR